MVARKSKHNGHLPDKEKKEINREWEVGGRHLTRENTDMYLSKHPLRLYSKESTKIVPYWAHSRPKERRVLGRKKENEKYWIGQLQCTSPKLSCKKSRLSEHFSLDSLLWSNIQY